ncbi:glyoxalase [Streptomyces sp. NPDC057445]|uniref:glyoxalase n=1 Tax=Streptomyces sp. NPDC057445 TaxID=3346136 RepID=UPI0036B84890
MAGSRTDVDDVAGENYRCVRQTPPGSECSIIFGKGITSAARGSVQDLYLIVFDIEAARAELVGRGVDVREVLHDAGGLFHHGHDAGGVVHHEGAEGGGPARTPPVRTTAPAPPSATRTATAGYSRWRREVKERAPGR